MLGAALAAAGALALAANALALSGSPIKLAEAASYGPPAVAVDSSGTAYVAWADELATPYTVHYCVIPAGASGCTHSGVLTPGGGSDAYIDKVQVLVDGSTVVVLADVYGVGEEYEPEQEWTSTNGGASFGIVNGGKSVGEGILNAATGPLNALIVPGSNALGYAWVTADGPPTFTEFPFGSTSECSVKAGHRCTFATLQPESSEHLLGNPAGAFASQLGANPGVLGVYETLGKPGCASGTFDSAYVYGSGAQETNNSYNVSPGTTKSAWKVGLSPGDCEVEYLAVGGGPSGFGVVEDNLANGTTVYHRFDQADDSFDTPYVTIANEGEESPSVSQDEAGGVFATFLAGFEGEVRFAYSYNGGTTWTGPATLSPAGGDHLVSSVDAAGQGWATWRVGESVYAQQFVADDAIAPPAADTVTTTQTVGAATGASLTIAPGTVGEVDRATITGVNAGSATGTVTYGLYSSSTCAASSEVFNGGTVAVTGGVAASSAPVTSALAPGTYYWQASYSGNTGTLEGARGNVPNVSSCGSEVLAVGAASGEYTVASVRTNSNGTVTIVLVPVQEGEATLAVTVPTASIARTEAIAAKTHKCKKGQIKLKGKCRPINTLSGKVSAKGHPGVKLTLTVAASKKVRSLLEKGRTVILTARLTYRSAFGGAAKIRTFTLKVKGKKPHGKH